MFAVQLRESFKACLSGSEEWATSYYSELLLDTLFEDADAAEVKDLEKWYIRGSELLSPTRLPPATSSLRI